ncbi:hypothetical protein ES703_75585 [subsurface metagenome]
MKRRLLKLLGAIGLTLSLICRISTPCGIAGGIWGLLAPVLVLLPITVRVEVNLVTGEQGEKEMVSMVEAGIAGDALPILFFIALMGLLGLLAIVLSKRRFHIGRICVWISALAMLSVSLVGIFSLGLLFLPASILLIVAAIGVRESEEIPVKEG